jgi:hypothetical protein
MKTSKKAKRIICLLLALSLLLGVTSVGIMTERIGVDRRLSGTNWEAKGLHYSGRLLIEALPEVLLERINSHANRSDQRAIAVDFLGEEDLMSFVSLNEDGTKTVYAFNEPIKFLCLTTDEIRFIGNENPTEERTTGTAYRSARNVDGTTVLRHIDPGSIISATYHTRQPGATSNARNAASENAAIYAMVGDALGNGMLQSNETMSATDVWKEFDITPLMQGWVASDLNNMTLGADVVVRRSDLVPDDRLSDSISVPQSA